MSNGLDYVYGALGVGEGFGNLSLQSQNLKYMKELQQKVWEREDTAVQRRVADLEKAGLSKTLATGSAADSSSPVSISAPQSDVYSRLVQAMGMKKTQAEIDYTKELAANAGVDRQYKNEQMKLVRSQVALNEAQQLLTTGNYELLGIQKEQYQQMIAESKHKVAKILKDMEYTDSEISLALANVDKARADIAYRNTLNEKEQRLLTQTLSLMGAQLAGQLVQNQIASKEYTYMLDNNERMPYTGYELGKRGFGLNILGNGGSISW